MSAKWEYCTVCVEVPIQHCLSAFCLFVRNVYTKSSSCCQKSVWISHCNLFFCFSFIFLPSSHSLTLEIFFLENWTSAPCGGKYLEDGRQGWKGHLRPLVWNQPGQQSETPCLQNNLKITQVSSCIPTVPATSTYGESSGPGEKAGRQELGLKRPL